MMARHDRSQIAKNMFIEGTALPAEMLIVKSRDLRKPPPAAPDLRAINDKLDAARKRLDEIAQAVRRPRLRR
jgi:hypothetical protein